MSLPITITGRLVFYRVSHMNVTVPFFFIGLAIHIAFDIAFLTIGEIAVARLNIIYNSPYGTTKQFRESG